MTYLTTEDSVNIPVSADEEIVREISRISDIEARGIQKINGVDWCLRRLLRKAHTQIQSGPAELDLEEERSLLLDDLSDETDVNWNDHFDKAVAKLERIFAPRN